MVKAKMGVVFVYRLFFLWTFILLPFFIEAQCMHHRAVLGPEVYHMTRIRDGSTRQKGTLYGISLLYERIRHCGIYWGVEGNYARGDLRGHSAGGSSLKSHKRDADIEGMLGLNYQLSFWEDRCLSITPIFGAGYFNGKNVFVAPSPLELTYTTKFSYYLYGGIITFHWDENISAGVRFKIKTMIEGKCYVSDDPEVEDFSMVIENERQYDVEIPLQLTHRWQGIHCHWLVAPFYRYRHYGDRENFPYDFYDTKFIMYGAKALLEVRF